MKILVFLNVVLLCFGCRSRGSSSNEVDRNGSGGDTAKVDSVSEKSGTRLADFAGDDSQKSDDRSDPNSQNILKNLFAALLSAAKTVKDDVIRYSIQTSPHKFFFVFSGFKPGAGLSFIVSSSQQNMGLIKPHSLNDHGEIVGASYIPSCFPVKYWSIGANANIELRWVLMSFYGANHPSDLYGKTFEGGKFGLNYYTGASVAFLSEQDPANPERPMRLVISTFAAVGFGGELGKIKITFPENTSSNPSSATDCITKYDAAGQQSAKQNP